MIPSDDMACDVRGCGRLMSPSDNMACYMSELMILWLVM